MHTQFFPTFFFQEKVYYFISTEDSRQEMMSNRFWESHKIHKLLLYYCSKSYELICTKSSSNSGMDATAGKERGLRPF